MIRKEEVFKIGTLGKTHGIKGEIVFNFTNDIFDREDIGYIICSMEGILVPFFIKDYRFKGNDTALLQIDGIDSDEKAKFMKGIEVFFPKKYMEEEDQLTWDFFVGMNIINNNNEIIGEIKEVDETTENVLFIVDRKGEEMMIPAIEDFIVEIDHEKGNIIMDFPEGLIDLND